MWSTLILIMSNVLFCEVINVPVGFKSWTTQVQDFRQSVKMLSVSTNVGDYTILGHTFHDTTMNETNINKIWITIELKTTQLER